MRKRFGRQEMVAIVLILGSAAVYWMRSNTPPIVFASQHDHAEHRTESVP